jgi:hypothetical protein
MEHLFFSLSNEIEDVSNSVFKALGIKHKQEGDSANVVGGIYYVHDIFGCHIKLESNGYDWDDQYNYMITVKKDNTMGMIVSDQNVNTLAKLICELLCHNLRVDVALELNDTLEIYRS